MPGAKLEVNGTTLLDQTATIALGDLSIANGNMNLPLTTNSTAGVITLGGASFIHGCCTGGATQNTFIGFQSGNFTMTGAGNLGMGGQTLLNNTAGGFNTAIGLAALQNNAQGNFNTAGGDVALQANTSGNSNTALGRGALQSNTNGSNNTALGNQAGSTSTVANANVTGNNNTFIGANSGPGSPTQLTNATALGYNSVVSANNSLALGGIGPDVVKVGIGIAAPGTTLDVAGDIRASGCIEVNATVISGTCSSDVRLKTNIEPFSPVLTRLAQLHPVHFDWRITEYPDYHFGSGRSSGVIAQEVEKIFPELVSTDKRGFKQVNYSEFPYLTLQAISELKMDNEHLREQMKLLSATKDEQIRKITQQVQELRQVKNEMTALEARLTRVETGSLAVAARKANRTGKARVKVAFRGSAHEMAALRVTD